MISTISSQIVPSDSFRLKRIDITPIALFQHIESIFHTDSISGIDTSTYRKDDDCLERPQSDSSKRTPFHLSKRYKVMAKSSNTITSIGQDIIIEDQSITTPPSKRSPSDRDRSYEQLRKKIKTCTDDLYVSAIDKSVASVMSDFIKDMPAPLDGIQTISGDQSCADETFLRSFSFDGKEPSERLEEASKPQENDRHNYTEEYNSLMASKSFYSSRNSKKCGSVDRLTIDTMRPALRETIEPSPLTEKEVPDSDYFFNTSISQQGYDLTYSSASEKDNCEVLTSFLTSSSSDIPTTFARSLDVNANNVLTDMEFWEMVLELEADSEGQSGLQSRTDE